MDVALDIAMNVSTARAGSKAKEVTRTGEKKISGQPHYRWLAI
jgi:hypothetical protein